MTTASPFGQIALISLAFACFTAVLPASAESMCLLPVKATMQRATGGFTLKKVGYKCTLVCPPTYYTVEKKGFLYRKLTEATVAGDQGNGYPTCPTGVNVYEIKTWDSTETISKFTWWNSMTMTWVDREGCNDTYTATDNMTEGGTQSTSVVYQTASSCSATKVSGAWSPSDCGVDGKIDTVMFGRTPSATTNPSCTTPGEKLVDSFFVSGSPCRYITGLNCTFEQITGSERSSEFTTTELKSYVEGKANARIPGTFSNGDPASVRTLDGNEECATATDAKYRILIVHYVPNTQYIIKYKVVARHRDGSSTSTQRRVSVRAPASGEWYYPSAAGAKLPKPPWPPGACTFGGTESITYTDVTIEEK